MTKRLENLIKKLERQYGPKLTDKQYEQLAKATLMGRVWGIRRSFGIKVEKESNLS